MGFNKKNSGDDYEIPVDPGEEANFEQMLQSSFSKQDKKLSVGDKIKAEILSVGKENLIVSTGTRTDGIVSVQDLEDANRKNEIKVGNFIDLYVTQIASDAISLSPYQAQPAGRSRFGNKGRNSAPSHSGGTPHVREQFAVGAQVKGKVTRVEPFGAFIELSPGLEGMAHISELSWTRVKNTSDIVKVGDVVTAQILSVEPGERKTKIALSLKQSDKNPWKNLPEQVQVGKIISGKITRTAAFGAFVEIIPGVEGLIPLSEMSNVKRINRAEDVVAIGQEVAVLVKDVNTETKRISLSLKAAENEAANASEAQDIKEFSQRQTAQNQGGSDFAAKMQAALVKKK